MITLPKLNYNYGDLEPYIDALTMEIHHTKHHQSYIDKANTAIEKIPEIANLDPKEIITKLDLTPENLRQVLINNLGGHLNHDLFWQIMTPGGTPPSPKIVEIINGNFGEMENFIEKFSETAINRFGSGWAWLVVNPDLSLEIMSTANQDSPLMQNKTPILGLDVWEHAYYLRYQNRRPEYIKNWWNVVNWQTVEKLYNLAVANKN